jgi:hypothetical protein
VNRDFEPTTKGAAWPGLSTQRGSSSFCGEPGLQEREVGHFIVFIAAASGRISQDGSHRPGEPDLIMTSAPARAAQLSSDFSSSSSLVR